MAQSDVQKLMHLPLNHDFGISLDKLASKAKGYGRFRAWLGGDESAIKTLLGKIEGWGVSTALFVAYEMNEGYNASWGWLNHTYPQGGATADAQSVCSWLVTQSKNMNGTPAWDDPGGGTIGVVPQDVITAGNADYKSLPSGSIGRVYIAGTAAATWAVYYPQALKASVNGVQNYGDPFAGVISVIKSLGGSFSGSSGETPKPGDNSNPGSGTGSTEKPKPKPDASGGLRPVALTGAVPIKLENDTKFYRFGNYLFAPDSKADGTVTNDTSDKDENHKGNTDEGNKDKPKPVDPDPSLDLKWLDAQQGKTIGSGQCYALAEAWAVHCKIPVSVLNGSTAKRWGTVPEPGVGVAWGAVNIGHDYPWKDWGWTVIDSPKLEDMKPGDIVCIFSDYVGGWTPPVGGVRYGHVVVCGEKSGGITTLWEQNGTAGMISVKQPKTSGRPTMETYVKCGFASLIRKGT